MEHMPQKESFCAKMQDDAAEILQQTDIMAPEKIWRIKLNKSSRQLAKKEVFRPEYQTPGKPSTIMAPVKKIWHTKLNKSARQLARKNCLSP